MKYARAWDDLKEFIMEAIHMNYDDREIILEYMDRLEDRYE